MSAPTTVIKIPATQEDTSPLERLRSISGTRQLDDLRERVSNVNDVIPNLVPRGTITCFYAWPNGGKTLFTFRALLDAVKDGRVDPSKVLYINEDDNLQGFITKCEIATPYGISVISSVQSTDQKIKSRDDILSVLGCIADTDECNELVVVFDTLKKFMSVMRKDEATRFFSLLRKLNAGGGTVILLAHANKHPSPEGRPIPQGVQDIKDDIDVMYAIECHSERGDEIQKCEFVNEKDRGVVAQRMAWQFRKSSDQTYEQMLESVSFIPDEQLAVQRKMNRERELRRRYCDAILFLESILSNGKSMIQSEIIALLKDDRMNPNGVSISNMRGAIKDLDGIVLNVEVLKHQNNSKRVSLLKNPTGNKEM